MKVIPREAGKQCKTIIFTELQSQLIIGSILGDASLVATGGGYQFRLQTEHCAEQKDYVWWKYEILKDLVKTPPKHQKKNNSWRFRTVSLPEFKKFRKIFYSNHHKVLPQRLDDLINHPRVLAIWYMDDGNLRREHCNIYGCMLNTHSFSYQENKKLRKFLFEKYRLKCMLQKNHRKYRLYFGSVYWQKFCTLVAPYIISSMRYKLP